VDGEMGDRKCQGLLAGIGVGRVTQAAECFYGDFYGNFYGDQSLKTINRVHLQRIG
jgi:hypothetical protein